MLTKDELEHEQYEARLKKTLDERSVKNYHERDLKQAMSNGIQLGRMAALVEKIRLLQQILKVPVTPAEDLRPRSETELLQLSAHLEQQALSR